MRDNNRQPAMDFAQELKSRVDIVAVIGERVRLRKGRRPTRYKGLCPFHTREDALV